MTSRALWAAVVGVSLFQPALAADRTPVVGDIGNPPELVVEGAKTFSPAEVAHALLANLDIANAMHPTAPLDELLRLLVSKTEEGYRDEGFGDISVRIVQDAPPRLRLVIDEGPRYMAGEIQIVGAKTIDAEWLKTQLLPDHMAGRDPRKKSPAQSTGNVKHWPVGKPAWFRRETIRQLGKYITTLLLHQGRARARCSVGVVRDRATKTAALSITIKDEGPPTVVRAITVTGNKKNSVADVLGFLGIHEGMWYRGGLEEELQEKLSQSGRFLRPKVLLGRMETPTGPLALLIELQEYEKAPPLRQPLSPEEAALAALGLWLNHFEESDEEILFEFRSPMMKGELVIAPKSGVLGTVRQADVEGTESPFAFAYVMADGIERVYSGRRQAKIEGTLTPSRLIAHVKFTLHSDPPNAGGQGQLDLGVDMTSLTHRNRRLALGFNDTAVGMLSVAHEHQTDFAWENGVLTARYNDNQHNDYQLKIDARSGRLIECRKAQPDGTVAVIAHAEGTFARRLKEINAQTTRWPNLADARRPISCGLEFLCDDALAWMDGIAEFRRQREVVQVLSKLCRFGAFTPLERLLAAASRDNDEQFSVPTMKPGEWEELLASEPMREVVHFFAHRAIGLSDDAAPRGSWLWSAWREGAFLAAGKQDHLYHELHRLYASRGTGPLQLLTMSAILRAFGPPEAAVKCGQEGIARLDIRHFRADYAPLLNPNVFLGDCLLNTAHVLRQLDQREVESLCETAVIFELASEGSAKQFAECVSQLRERKNEPLPVAVAAVLDNCWETCLKQRVEMALRNNLRAVRTARRDSPRRPDSLRESPPPDARPSRPARRYDPAADRFDFPSIRPNRR